MFVAITATAHQTQYLQYEISENYVWPSPNGKVRGQSIVPLYPNQIRAVLNDEKLYNMLVLIDSVRVGKVRECEKALELLRQIFGLEYA